MMSVRAYMVRFFSRFVYVGIVFVCICLGILFLFEGILRIRYNTIPITHEFFLLASDIQKSATYIFEKKRDSRPDIGDTDKYRIAVLGDSFSACDKFVAVICYPDILESMMGSNDTKMVIRSYGLAGNNTDRELRYFIDHVLPTRPNLVIWQMYSNDVWENVIFPVYIISGDHRLLGVSGAENWAYKRQAFFEILPMKRVMLQSYVVRWMLRQFEFGSYQFSPYGDDDGRIAWGLEKIRLEVAEMNRLSHEYGFTVLYMQIPTQSIYLAEVAPLPEHQWMRKYNLHVYAAIEAILQQQKGYVSLQFPLVVPAKSDVLGVASESAKDHFYMHEEDANIVGDKHLNQAGNQVVAEQLVNRIHLLMQETVSQ